jgi:hypothetical protein
MAWAGVAPHSVRAVPLDYLKTIISFANERGFRFTCTSPSNQQK